jgi:hypothetical protein
VSDAFPDVSDEFKGLVDAVIAAGHTCQTVLPILEARIKREPPGQGRDNLNNFRKLLKEKMKNERHV